MLEAFIIVVVVINDNEREMEVVACLLAWDRVKLDCGPGSVHIQGKWRASENKTDNTDIVGWKESSSIKSNV